MEESDDIAQLAQNIRRGSSRNKHQILQKKMYTREKIRGIRISRLAEIDSLFHDCLR